MQPNRNIQNITIILSIAPAKKPILKEKPKDLLTPPATVSVRPRFPGKIVFILNIVVNIVNIIIPEIPISIFRSLNIMKNLYDKRISTIAWIAITLINSILLFLIINKPD